MICSFSSHLREPIGCLSTQSLGAVFGAVFLDYIKCVSAFQASLDRVNVQQVNPLKSLHIEKTIVRLSLALLLRARPKSKTTALF